jgi:hypothetical protein
MDWNSGGSGKWACAVKRRARQRALYHADPAAANYLRSRYALRVRIARKRQLIEQMEERLAQEDAS